MENYDDAYKEVVRRLRTAPLVPRFDGTKMVPVLKITEDMLEPVKIYEECVNDILKITTKKALYAKKTTKKAPPLKYLWLTINPKPSIKWEDFKIKCFKLFGTTLFASYRAVFEQRGTTDQLNIGQGFHLHVLFQRHMPLNDGLPPANLTRNLKNSWKNYCDTKNPHCFNIQYIGDEYALDKLDYMVGLKTGDGKDAKQLGDIAFRYEKGTEASYGNLEKGTI